MALAAMSSTCCAPLGALRAPRGDRPRGEATPLTASPALRKRRQGLASALSHSSSHAHSASHCSARRHALVTRAVASGVQATALPESWASFSSLVSGEWEGYASDFETDGTPVQLPESAVPQAFRDWGLSLFAWQSHSSSLADPTGMVSCRTQRFMPAVACDSLDPPLFSVQEELFGNSQLDTGVLAFRSDGSFAAARPGRSVLRSGVVGQGKVVQREEVGSELVFELEHCLVAQDPEGSGGRARVRVLQQYERQAPDAVPRLVGLSLYRERWTGAYAGDAAADGGSTSFAEGPAVGLEAVEGRWLATKMVATLDQVCTVIDRAVLKSSPLGPRGTIMEMVPGGTEEVTRQLTEEGAVFLPQGVWSRVLPTSSGGVILKAGWLVEADKAIVSRFDFSKTGQLEGVTISTETRISATV